MWNEPTEKQLSAIPKLYETETTPLRDKIVHMHFFIGGCDWFIIESDGKDILFGYAILNGDSQNAEWGYSSLRELKETKVDGVFEVERDLHWLKKPAFLVGKITESGGI